MPRKAYSKTKRYCRLTFKLSVDESIKTVALCLIFRQARLTSVFKSVTPSSQV
jgi:hypothetical protein